MGSQARWITLAVLGLLAIPFTYFTIHAMRSPALYPGDRLETRTCRECGGTGVERGESEETLLPPPGEASQMPREGPREGPPGYPKAGDPCIACGGKTKVRVIIPGPNHPSWVKGTVFDAAQAPRYTGTEFDEGQAAAQFMANRNPMQPIPGAIAAAKIVVENGGQKLEV